MATRSCFARALFLLSISWPAAIVGQTQTPAVSADDLLLVDCRLPARQVRTGGYVHLVAGRPVRTTAVDCRIRGGEYTVYDRANYQTSLKIWLAEAEKGNAEAQYYVGKIYEGGLGTEPDYKSAAVWYEKAANAGHSASQFSLGNLYEKGLGVPADNNKAFALYRKAAGLSGDFRIVESGRLEALEQAAQDLALREQEIEELQRQLEAAKKKIKRDETRERDLQQKLDEQKRSADRQKSQLATIQAQLKKKPSEGDRIVVAAPLPIPLPAPRGGMGRYFALVIGNGQYERLGPVPSAERDAKAMQALLEKTYRFQVTLLLNAKKVDIEKTLYRLSQALAADDNLVVYYAGHGKRDLRNRRGWWLPVDADPDNDAKTNWLPNQDVSDRLALIPARHILVVADASYVGDITRGAPQLEPQGMTPAQWKSYVEATARKKSRLALSSGADEPLGGAAGQSSRFTATLINVLQRQKGVFSASQLHREVVNALTADEHVTSAIPTFAPLQTASHEGVDFLFERR